MIRILRISQSILYNYIFVITRFLPAVQYSLPVKLRNTYVHINLHFKSPVVFPRSFLHDIIRTVEFTRTSDKNLAV